MVDTYLKVSGIPEHFSGEIRLPPSKSYFHRALFVAAIASTSSRITNCGYTFSDDMNATISALRAFGVKIGKTRRNQGTLNISPGNNVKKEISLHAKGSGTTARFAISFAALAGDNTITHLSGDDSLSKRPMQEIYEALSQLGVRCEFEKNFGRLPMLIRGGGIRGGRCEIDGSISSQFISSLLISCTRAQSDCEILLKNPSKLVSKPYIEATLKVLGHFGFDLKVISSTKFRYIGFKIKGNQKINGVHFPVPGDMSTAAALIGAAIASKGQVKLLGINRDLPQSDSVIVPIAKRFGAGIRESGESLSARTTITRSQPASITLNLGDSPDLVPVVVGLSAATGLGVTISGISHLRYKESDRLRVLSRELTKLGVKTRETTSSIRVSRDLPHAKQIRKPILLDPDRDHRMLMALTIAGLSGRFGVVRIKDPDCVKKSYPSFVVDIQRLCHERRTLNLVKARHVGRRAGR